MHIILGLVFAIYAIIYLIWCYRKPVRLIYSQVIYIGIVKFLITMGLPSVINYFTDIICIWLLVCTIVKHPKKEMLKVLRWPLVFISFQLLFSIFSYIYNGYSFLWYLWSFRNYYRFYAFMIGAVAWLEVKDLSRIMKILNTMLYVNVIVCAIQFFGWGIKGDYLGGLFGTSQGANGYMNIFLCLVFTYTVIGYIAKKVTLKKSFLVVISCVFIAALAEMKFFLLMIVIIIFCGMLFSRPNFRSIVILFIGMAVTIVGVNVLTSIFPGWSSFFTIDGLMNNAKSGYTGGESLSRTTALQVIAEQFLKTPGRILLGIGMGNADLSQFPILMSDFAKAYDPILHYSWLSYAFLFLEGGLAGLFAYCSVFFASFFLSMKQRNRFPDMGIFSSIMALLCLALLFYNSAMRAEAGYYMYFVLAIPYILRYKLRVTQEKQVSGMNIDS